jgi:hypothetical protein
MMENFRLWYLRNATEITWFIIGWMTISGLDSLAKGDYVNMCISWSLAGVNYMLYRK